MIIKWDIVAAIGAWVAVIIPILFYAIKELEKKTDIRLAAKTNKFSGEISFIFKNISAFDASNFFCNVITTLGTTTDDRYRILDSDIQEIVKSQKICHHDSIDFIVYLTDEERKTQRGDFVDCRQPLYVQYGYDIIRPWWWKNSCQVVYKILVRKPMNVDEADWREALPNDLAGIHQRRKDDDLKEINLENRKHPNFRIIPSFK